MWSHPHDGFTIHQLPVLTDNYIFLIEARAGDVLAAVDPATSEDVIIACRDLQRPLTHILNTHHHWDHTDGNLELKEHFGCMIVGAARDAARIPGIDIEVDEPARLNVGSLGFDVLDVPGHTRAHIAFVLHDALFCGDTLFGAGCGRLFEGTASQMWESLNKLMQLPDSTRVYCAHEYTISNLGFAAQADPDNVAVATRLAKAQKLRDRQLPTVPSTLAEERASNPFLRPADADFCHAYAGRHCIEDNALAVFTHLRAKKDLW